jgi:hypothetical protein
MHIILGNQPPPEQDFVINERSVSYHISRVVSYHWRSRKHAELKNAEHCPANVIIIVDIKICQSISTRFQETCGLPDRPSGNFFDAIIEIPFSAIPSLPISNSTFN